MTPLAAFAHETSVDWEAMAKQGVFACAIVEIDPDTARRMLARNKLNRKLNHRNVSMYISDMAAGRWRARHPDSIAFDADGHLFNGQHRLHAVIQADRTIQVVVVFGADPASRQTVDGHSKKSIGHRLFASGHDIASTETGVTRAHQIGMRMRSGIKTLKQGYTPADQAEYLNTHRDAILFAMDCFHPHPKVMRVTVAGTLAVWACAYYHAEDQPARDRLRAAAGIMATGASVDPTATALRLVRDWLLAQVVQPGSNQNGLVFGKLARALKAYLDHEPLKVVRMPIENPFPVP